MTWSSTLGVESRWINEISWVEGHMFLGGLAAGEGLGCPGVAQELPVTGLSVPRYYLGTCRVLIGLSRKQPAAFCFDAI